MPCISAVLGRKACSGQFTDRGQAALCFPGPDRWSGPGHEQLPCGGTARSGYLILVAKEAPSPVRGHDTGPMRDRWVHVGRLWTNGDPFLAVDAALRYAWHGYSNADYHPAIPLVA